ncbi:hypothetical protein [Sorangium sp. So ce406]|uniref:hypothetical protein n=1 Tax=Sorangium sp. So ce406 TaxID=3133311 RepID=UPI003F5B8611
MHLGSLLFPALLALPLAAHGGQSSGDLVAAAAAAGRPPECSARTSRAIARGPTVWERARAPELPRYCDLLARGQAQLGGNPEAARESARLADQILPGHAAPQVLLARAALALGSPGDAARAFDRARHIDPRSVEDPPTLHGLARSLARTGKRDEALAMYRALVPRIDLLGTADQRALVLLEAAHLSMAAAGAAAGAAASTADAGAKPQGGARGEGARADLDEAIAYLREARQRSQSQLARDVTLSLALALDRAGDRAQADAALEGEVAGAAPEATRARAADPHAGAAARARAAGQQAGAAAQAADPHAGAAAREHAADDLASAAARLRSVDYLAAPEDRLALEALALERTSAAAAIARWEAYLSGAGGEGPWAAAARARLDALRKGAGGGGPRPARAPRERVAAPARAGGAP